MEWVGMDGLTCAYVGCVIYTAVGVAACAAAAQELALGKFGKGAMS
jgi:hypothetical protein